MKMNTAFFLGSCLFCNQVLNGQVIQWTDDTATNFSVTISGPGNGWGPGSVTSPSGLWRLSQSGKYYVWPSSLGTNYIQFNSFLAGITVTFVPTGDYMGYEPFVEDKPNAVPVYDGAHTLFPPSGWYGWNSLGILSQPNRTDPSTWSFSLYYHGSGPALLQLPGFVTQPQDTTITNGGTASFSGLVYPPNKPKSFQWRFNGANLTHGGRFSISSNYLSLDTSKLTITNVLLADAGDYTLVASNSVGVVTSAVARLTVLPTLLQVGHANDGGIAYGVAVSNQLACVVGSEGLCVYDVTVSASPLVLGHTNTSSGPPSVALKDRYAVLANYGDGLRIYDIADPTNLVSVGHAYDGGKGQYVRVSGSYAYLANDSDGLRIYDISTPTNPFCVGHANDGGKAFGVCVAGNYAYLANNDDGLRIYDVSNPANPMNVGHANDAGAAWNVVVSGNHAYVANSSDGLRIYNVSNPTNPVSVGHINQGGSACDVAVAGRLAYLANGSDGLRIYNISNPTNPVALAHVNDGGSANGVAVAGDTIYVANSSDGLRVYSFTAGGPNLGITRSGGTLRLALAGLPGDVCRVLASSNLFDWQAICTLTNVTGSVQFSDLEAPNFNARFYRCVIP